MILGNRDGRDAGYLFAGEAWGEATMRGHGRRRQGDDSQGKPGKLWDGSGVIQRMTCNDLAFDPEW